MRRILASGLVLVVLAGSGCATGPSRDLAEGWDFMLANDYPAARDTYLRILEEYPENPYAHLNLGVAYQQLGETDLARRHYEAAIAHGDKAEVTRIVEQGEVVAKVTTVADKGRENLQTLPR